MESSDWSGREDSSRVGGYVREGRDWHVRKEQRAPTASRTVPSVVGGSVHGKMHDLRCNTVVGAVGILHAGIGSSPRSVFRLFFLITVLRLGSIWRESSCGCCERVSLSSYSAFPSSLWTAVLLLLRYIRLFSLMI